MFLWSVAVPVPKGDLTRELRELGSGPAAPPIPGPDFLGLPSYRCQTGGKSSFSPRPRVKSKPATNRDVSGNSCRTALYNTSSSGNCYPWEQKG